MKSSSIERLNRQRAMIESVANVSARPARRRPQNSSAHGYGGGPTCPAVVMKFSPWTVDQNGILSREICAQDQD
jgi:hypothetical protein